MVWSTRCRMPRPTARKGFTSCLARASAKPPSSAATIVVANCWASSGGTPCSTNLAATVSIQPVNTLSVPSRSLSLVLATSGDGADGARVDEVGLLQHPCGAFEKVGHCGRRRVARGGGDELEELSVGLTRGGDYREGQVVLAAGEEVVQRPGRGLSEGRDLFEGGAVVAVAAVQLVGGGHDPYERSGAPERA